MPRTTQANIQTDFISSAWIDAHQTQPLLAYLRCMLAKICARYISCFLLLWFHFRLSTPHYSPAPDSASNHILPWFHCSSARSSTVTLDRSSLSSIFVCLSLCFFFFTFIIWFWDFCLLPCWVCLLVLDWQPAFDCPIYQQQRYFELRLFLHLSLCSVQDITTHTEICGG